MKSIESKPRLTPYPPPTSGVFTGWAAQIPDPNKHLMSSFWLESETWLTGKLTQLDILQGAPGRSVPFPEGDIINFQALTSHEAGHGVARWLYYEKGVNPYEIMQTDFINVHQDILTKFTSDSFNIEKYPTVRSQQSEVFAELFAASRVLEEFDAGKLDANMVPGSLLQPEVRELVIEFTTWLDSVS